MQRKHMGEKISGTGLLQGVNQPRHETELQIRTGEGKYRIFAERNAPASLNLMGGHRRHCAFYGCGACMDGRCLVLSPSGRIARAFHYLPLAPSQIICPSQNCVYFL